MCPTGQRRRMHRLTGPTGPTVQPTTPVNMWHGELCSTGDAKYSDVCKTRQTTSNNGVFGSVVLSCLMITVAATDTCRTLP
jgi:hypothetical protein